MMSSLRSRCEVRERTRKGHKIEIGTPSAVWIRAIGNELAERLLSAPLSALNKLMSVLKIWLFALALPVLSAP